MTVYFVEYAFLNLEIKNGYAKFETFLGSDSRGMLRYVSPSLESGNYDSTVLHFVVNHLMQKALK